MTGHPLDLDAWPRRQQFDFFRTYDIPFFNLCAEVEVTAMRAFCRAHGISFTLAAWYTCLSTANAVEPFRYRLRGDGVWVHDRIDVGTTILRRDETFGFCYFDHADTFSAFRAGAEAALAAFHSGAPGLVTRDDRDDLLHGSTIPWVRFTSVSHARRFNRTDSIPKLAFGRFIERGPQSAMPVSVEVHHALMDGLHVGRFFEQLQAALDAPEHTLGAARPPGAPTA